ncbi:MAG: FAD binding domain-containing protein [Chloroflexi bacterium]|nr:FAD binding domain-containing protein [Chloroflexota bacterium]
MRLPKFECFYPCSVDEATSFLAAHKGECRIIAGGTDILIAMKQRRSTPKYLVNLKGICELSNISYDQKDGLRIGALATLDVIAESGEVRELVPMLAQAAGKVASPHLRNAGTLGGNVCLETRCWYYNQSEFWRSAREKCFKTGGDRCYVVKGGKQCYSLVSADTAPALIALGAEVELVGASGKRTVPLEKFYTGVGQTPNVVNDGEVLTLVRVPNQPKNSGGVYLKHAYRESIDFPLVGVGVVLSLDGGDTCRDVRVCVGAASPAPVRTVKAESILKGKPIADDVLKEVGDSASKEVSPIVNLFASVPYKRHIVGVLVQRAIKQAFEAAKSARG